MADYIIGKMPKTFVQLMMDGNFQQIRIGIPLLIISAAKKMQDQNLNQNLVGISQMLQKITKEVFLDSQVAITFQVVLMNHHFPN